MCTESDLQQWLPLIQQQVTMFLSSAAEYYPEETLIAIMRVLDREDLVQECCLAFLEKANQYDPSRGAMSTYLCAIFQHRMIDVFRKASSPLKIPRPSDARALKDPEKVQRYVDALRFYTYPKTVLGEYLIPADADRDPTERYIQQEQAERADVLLRKVLPREEVEMLHARMNGETVKAIATRYGRPLNSVTARLKNLLSEAKAILTKEGFR